MVGVDRRRFTLGALGAPWLASAAAAQPGDSFPSDEAVRGLLVERVDTQRRAIGLAVGLVEPAGRRTVAYGRFGANDPRRVGRETVFRIGSLSKVFTALLLAEMVQRREVGLDDPVAPLLPDLPIPTPPGRPISLADLATHTAGLPFGPPATGRSYSLEAARAILADLRPDAPAGTRWQYSNLGSGLLGLALAQRANRPYEELLRSRVTAPLGMRATGVRPPSPQVHSRFAPGHDDQLRPVVPPRNPAPGAFDIFAPAGGLYSSAHDMTALLALMGGQGPARLVAAAASMTQTRRPAPQIRGQQALGWEVYGQGGAEFLSKEGSVFGYNAAMACEPKAGRGVAVLSNVEMDVGDIAKHLLRPSLPLSKAYKPVHVGVELLDRYAGAYRTAGFILTFDRDGETLWVKIPGVVRAPMIAIGPGEFAQPQIGVEFAFQLDAAGPVQTLTVRRAGLPDATARRVEP